MYQLLKTIDITPKSDCEDVEFISPVKLVTLFSDREIDQHEMAYSIFKSAKLVSVLDCVSAGDDFLYKIQVTNMSPEEMEYDMTYGDDYNDFND